MDRQPRYSPFQIAKAVNMEEYQIIRMRRANGVAWRADGYTFAEVLRILGQGFQVPDDEYIVDLRSRKAFELAQELRFHRDGDAGG